jgi:RNA polymerase sigma-70 factor (ECF subfamily)
LAEDILKRIALGDRAAVEECLDQYGGLVWSLARKSLWNAEDAEDAVQEIFIDIWKNAERFDPERSSETTFIAMIARRRIIDRLRFAGRRIKPEPLEDITKEPFSGSHEKIQVCVEASQAAKAINELKPEQKQVLQLAIVEGFSHQEIADATGMPLGTVKTHARRGIMHAREMLGVGRKEASA